MHHHTVFQSFPRSRFTRAAAATLALVVAVPEPLRAAVTASSEENITVRQRPLAHARALQNTPQAVTSVDRKLIDQTHDANLQQIQRTIPSLQILGFNPRNVEVLIRGLGMNTGSTNDNIEQGSGIYLDGVYYARPSITLFDLPDLDQVDVFRGPSGTEGGNTAPAGAVRVSTRLPEFTPHADADISYASHNYVRARADVTGALLESDKVAFRLTATSTTHDGYDFNTSTHARVDDLNARSVRAQILYQPTDRVSVRLIADYNNQIEQTGFYVPLYALPDRLADGTSAPSFAAKAASLGYVPGFNASRRQVDYDTSERLRMETGGLSAELNGILASDASLKSITAFRYWTWSPSLDGDGLALPIVTGSNLPTRQRQFSQELRYTSAPSRLIEYSAGLYYLWQNSIDNQFNSYGSAAAPWIIGSSVPANALTNVTAYANIRWADANYAAYAQSTLHITPRLSLLTGLRYSYEDKRGTYDAFGTGAVVPLSSYAPAARATVAALRARLAPTLAYGAQTHDSGPGGRIALSYLVAPQTLAYGSFSHGFKAGALNLTSLSVGRVIAPETVDDYEVGVKTTLLNDRLLLSGALFWENDHGYQASFLDPTARVSYITNAGEAVTRGAEFDIHAMPVRGLTVSANGTYDDAYFSSYPNAPCPYLQSNHTSCNISGSRVPGVSRWSGFVAANYEHPVGPRLVAYGGGDYSIRTGYNGTLNDDVFGAIKAYGILGLHAGVRSSRQGWDFSIWCRNALDTHYLTNTQVNTTALVAAGSLGEPRLVGFTLKASL